MLQPFGAVPPLVTDIALSVDDRSCTSPAGAPASSSATTCPTRAQPARPARCGSAASSSARRTRPPAAQRRAADGRGPRDGRRVYLTNSLYAAWDAQFYPEGIDGWLVKLDAGEDGSLTLDPDVFVEFSGERPHQVRLAGGDASSDSYCFPGSLMDPLWPWILMALLGAYHGLNPAMGWLFAVALGMQERDRRPVLRRCRRSRSGTRRRSCSWPCVVSGSGWSPTPSALHIGAGVALIAFGIFRFVKPRAHFRWVA